jgi:hypothetical protein
MMMSRAPAVLAALMVAVTAHASPSSPWDELAHPNRRRCSLLAQEAAKLAEQHQPKAAVQARPSLSAHRIGSSCRAPASCF